MRLGRLLGGNRAATSCVDLSDGLADGLHQLAQASGAGFDIDARAVPVPPAAARVVRGARARTRCCRR